MLVLAGDLQMRQRKAHFFLKRLFFWQRKGLESGLRLPSHSARRDWQAAPAACAAGVPTQGQALHEPELKVTGS